DEETRQGMGIRWRQGAQELGEVVEQATEARGVAASMKIAAGTPAVQEENAVAGFCQPLTRMPVPAGMALNPVHAHHFGADRASGRVMPINQGTPVADWKSSLAPRARAIQGAPPCAP